MKIETMHIILALVFLVIAVSVWNAHKNHATVFNAFDLLMENGKVSKIAVAFMLVLIVSTWVIIDMRIDKQLTEGMFGLWLGAWVTPLVAKVVFGKNDAAAGTTITTSIQQTEKTTS